MITIDLTSPLLWLALLFFAFGPIVITNSLLSKLDHQKERGLRMATYCVGAQLGLVGGIGFYGFLITSIWHITRWIVG